MYARSERISAEEAKVPKPTERLNGTPPDIDGEKVFSGITRDTSFHEHKAN